MPAHSASAIHNAPLGGHSLLAYGEPLLCPSHLFVGIDRPQCRSPLLLALTQHPCSRDLYCHNPPIPLRDQTIGLFLNTPAPCICAKKPKPCPASMFAPPGVVFSTRSLSLAALSPSWPPIPQTIYPKSTNPALSPFASGLLAPTCAMDRAVLLWSTFVVLATLTWPTFAIDPLSHSFDLSYLILIVSLLILHVHPFSPTCAILSPLPLSTFYSILDHALLSTPTLCPPGRSRI